MLTATELEEPNLVNNLESFGLKHEMQYNEK